MLSGGTEWSGGVIGSGWLIFHYGLLRAVILSSYLDTVMVMVMRMATTDSGDNGLD